MIFGVCSFDQNSEKTKNFFPFFNAQEIRIIPVNVNGLTGGYFLNKSLPYSKKDVFFFDKKNDCFILFFGSIFNRSELISKYFNGQFFPDPELISKLFLINGELFVKEINGDFSLIIFQQKKNRLWLFRDHLGIKPLAFYRKGSDVWFSTDHVSLCKYFHDKKERINLNSLLTFRKIINTTETYNSKVKKVLPGHICFFDKTTTRVIKYWEPEKIKENKALHFSEAIEKIKFYLEDSVKIRCESRFNAASHLSGGLDSSLVAVLARKNYPNQKEFHGFSYAPEEKDYKEKIQDERLLVVETCMLNDIKPMFSRMDYLKYKQQLSDYFFNLGWIWEEEVRLNAKNLGINLIFSGWGGDEFISSSQRGFDIELFLGLKWRTFFKRNPLNKPRAFLSNLFHKVFLPFFGLISISLKKSFKESLVYIKKEYSIFDKTSFKNYFKYWSKKDVLIGIINNYHIAERTEVWSIHGFRHGIEYRYPLLDKRIIEFVLSIPSKLYAQGNISRVFLREASLNILPESVRLNETKLDVVFLNKFSSIISRLGKEITSELMEFKQNPDLDIIDFELLEKDAKKYFNNPNDKKLNLFPGNLVFIKMLHEFTKTYRSLPESSQE